MSENFGTVVVADFEYEIKPGDLPVPLCIVAQVLDEHLQHVRTIRLWREMPDAAPPYFGTTPPFDIGPDTLLVAYSAWAEMTCFMALGWRFPVHIFDLHTAYLAASNVLLPYNPDEVRKKPRKRLPDACRAYGIEGWERIDKDEIAKAIGEGRWYEYGQERVFEYCEEDVRMSVKLLRAQLRRHCDARGRTLLPAADVEHVLHWSNYSAKAVARIQARGMPIDVELWNRVQENKAAVIGELLRQFDPSYGSDDPIYTPEGEWSYARFERWLVCAGVTAWSRLESGKLDIDGDAFRLMYHVPGIEGLHALRDTLGEGRRPLPGQASHGEADVEHDYDRAAGRQGPAGTGRGMTDYVIRHGRRIRVGTLDTGAPVKTRRQTDPFVKASLRWAAAAAKATRTPQALVWIWLLRLAFEARSPTFTVPNGRLKGHGVSRFAKTRALANLETAGLINVERRPGKSPRVTLVNP